MGKTFGSTNAGGSPLGGVSPQGALSFLVWFGGTFSVRGNCELFQPYRHRKLLPRAHKNNTRNPRETSSSPVHAKSLSELSWT